MNPFEKIASNPEDEKRICTGLLKLRKALDSQIPPRTIADTLLLSTFNIRELDGTKFGRRTDESLFYLAEIISRFDLVAVQEVKRDLTGLIRLQEKLGSWWKYIVTDATEGTRGNDERMAFLYDSRKVRFGSVSGEVVIPPKANNNPSDQLARTPYIVGFESGWFRFSLCTVHILYGKDKAEDPERVKEIEMIAQFMKKRSLNKYEYSNNIILLGDFNIFSPDDITFKAIVDQGFKIPKQLQKIPSNVAQNKYYDQIAFLSKSVESQLDSSKAGVFNFFEHVYTEGEESVYKEIMGAKYLHSSAKKARTPKEKAQYYKDWRTYQMSDHLPMWIELKIDFSNELLIEKAK